MLVYGMVWNVIVWFGMIIFGTAWHGLYDCIYAYIYGMVWFGMIIFGMVWFVWLHMVWYGWYDCPPVG